MSIFLTYYAVALVLLYLEIRRPHAYRAPPTPEWPQWIWCAAIVVTYGLQLVLIWYAATPVAPEAWRVHLPIGVATHNARHPDATAAALLALSALQCFALLAIYRAHPKPAGIAATAIALVALSIAAPAFISPDPYAYVGDAVLGRAAYAPPHGDFAGEDASINRFFASPMLPAPYGPLWIALAQLATFGFPTLFGKLLALRVLGAASLLALFAGLHALRVPRRVLAVAAVNPGLVLQYVANAHNDLLGIAAIVVAAGFLPRNRLVASALVVVAALIKLPFALLALPIFSVIRGRENRYACAAGIVVVAIVLSYAGAGAGYFQGLAVHVPEAGFVHALNAAVSIAALAAIVVALLSGRRYAAAVWLMPMMGSYVASWYVTYGAPYALARRRILASALILLPFVALLFDAKFMRVWTYAALVPAIGVAAIAARLRAPAPA